MADNTKPCSKCKKVLPVSEFYKVSGELDKYRSKCKKCFYIRKTPLPEILPEGKKRCSKCKDVKSLEEFYATKERLKDGSIVYRSACKVCVIDRKTPLPEVFPDGMKRCFNCKEIKPFDEFDMVSKGSNKPRPHCKVCRAFLARQKYSTDEEYKNKIIKRQVDFQAKKYTNDEEYRKKIVKKTAKEGARRYKEDPEFNIKVRIRNSLKNAFNHYSENGKIATSRKYGIDYKAIINKLGLAPADGYDIDHIIPVSLFDHDDKKQVKLCWAAENLQWMKHIENLEKLDAFSENMEDYPEELHQHWKVAYKNYLKKKGD